MRREKAEFYAPPSICPDFFEISEGHRMAAAGIQGKLDINAANLCGALLGDDGSELIEIDIALERIMRVQIMSAGRR